MLEAFGFLFIWLVSVIVVSIIAWWMWAAAKTLQQIDSNLIDLIEYLDYLETQKETE